MRKIIFCILSLLLVTGCKKNEPELSGIVKINNKLVLNEDLGAYYSLGFTFSVAKKISTLSATPPDISVDVYNSVPNIQFQTNTLLDPFYKVGDYADAQTAKQAFNALTTVSVPAWEEWAVNILPNQVWIFRDKDENYAKLRIISTICELREGRAYAECEFEWVYQPDGTSIFPTP